MADTTLGSANSWQTLAIGTSEFSAIDFVGDTDWWKVNLVYGFQYQVWLEGSTRSPGTLVDPYLAVYSGAGTFAFANDDASFLSYYSYATVTPSSTGYLFLSAEEYGNNAIGTYTITIWQDELASTASAATVQVNSVSGVGHIGWQGDTSDWYAVTLTAGVMYQFDMIGSAGDGTLAGLTLIDPWLELRSSVGVPVAWDDDSGLGLNSRIYFTPTTSGTYYLDAQESGSNASGTYQLVVNATPTVGALDIGTLQSGAIDFAGDADLYSVVLTSGVCYAFAVDGTTLTDPYLEVLDSTGSVVSFDDDSGSGLDAYVTYTPATGGTYFLAARESGNNATGSYSARVWQLPTVSIANASVIEGNSGTTDLVFTLTLSAVSPIDVSVTAATYGTSTATYSSDYTPASASVMIAVGQTSATFTVQVLGDLIFEPTESFHVLLSNPTNAVLGASDAYGEIVDNDNPYSLPSDSLVGYQWYLYPTIGINAFPVWVDYTGAGVRVAVFDQGIDQNHPDLDGNLLINLGRKASDLTAGGAPILSSDNHGTMVAGTIAAELNGRGVVGVAYGANLVSIYNQMTLAEIPNALTYAENFDILNDSWGFAPQGYTYPWQHWAFADNFQTSTFAAAGAALADLASNGRRGLGTVVVQSAGNSFGYGDDTNLHNFQNSQYIVTVAATDYAGNVTSYSSPGASVLIAAPGGGNTDLLSNIVTTDRVGAAGTDTSDYASTAGTSFSAPIVSGIVALMLEANSSLGYRDVQEILAYSAREIGAASNDWRYNGASNWNGGGLHYDALSHNLGYGMVDALAAVRLAETWTETAHTASNKEQITTTHSVSKAIPDGGGINAVASAFDAISVTQAINVERVEVTLSVAHPYIGDLSILLMSPSGTTSFLLWRPQQNALSAYGTSQNDIHFTFDTVLDWGESSVGSWGLAIYDNAYGDVGTFDSWTLNLIGKPASADDIYIYTNEFTESCADQAARSVLSDTGGTDTLNAAACSSDLVLNLVEGGISTIDGASLTIAVGTLIENAYGGDGNDAITGNDVVNILYGMRGDDRLDGGAGADSLFGGTGNDIYVVDNIGDVVTENLSEGTDLIQSAVSYTLAPNVENLTFTGTSSINAAGNGLDNILTGNAGANSLDGGLGNDIMYGGAGNDTFDWDVNQRAGDDTMYGGAGNDTYVISGDDQIVEYASEGIDTIWSAQSYSLVSMAYVEYVCLFGTLDVDVTGNIGANNLRGNSANNLIDGRAGDDILVGGDGIDTALFSGTWAEYALTPTPTGWTLVGPDGSDSLTTIEFAKFTDQTLSLGNFAPTGGVSITGTATQGVTLMASNNVTDADGISSSGVGAIAYQWQADGAVMTDATTGTLLLSQAEVGKIITVVASYTDDHGTLESVTSSATSAVANVNDAPTGSVTISGAATQGQNLNAANTLADADGLGTVSYQWQAAGIVINGATANNYALTEGEVGKTITVSASYTDGFGTHESVSSIATSAVGNVNELPTGSVTISGAATQGQTLTAANTLTDADGVGAISYQWQADGTVITGAVTSTFLVTDAQVGKSMTVVVSYTDGHGTAESVSSSAVLVAVGKTADLLTYSWKAHTLLDGVSVSAGTHSGTTDATGTISFTAITNPSLTLTASRAVPPAEATATASAVNLQDAIAILKMIVGLPVNGADQALSPYQSLAADFDGNGTVGLTDAIGVLKHVVGLTAPEPTWHFVNATDASLTTISISPLAPGNPPVITADLGGSSPVQVELVGYLSGDVDGSFA